jgi:hypothetical protein
MALYFFGVFAFKNIMKGITKEDLLVQKELRLEELKELWLYTITTKEDLNIGKQVYSTMKEIVELKKELGLDYSLDQILYKQGNDYYKAVDNKKDFKVSIILDNGKEITINENTSLSDLNLEELADANKKLSSLILIISKILK